MVFQIDRPAGRITAQRVLTRPSEFTSRKVGTMPPRKNIGMSTKMPMTASPRRSLRDRGYARHTVSTRLSEMPAVT